MKTKVCHVTSAHNSNDVRIFHKECASLAKAGYETYLVARGDSREEKGVHVIGVGEAPGNRIKRMTEFSQRVVLKAIEIDADIYHIHDPELLTCCVKLKKAGKTVIFDSHENYPAQILEKKYLPRAARNIISNLFHKFETKVVRKIDAVVVPCTFDGKNIFEGRASKTVYIANYPLLADFYDNYNPEIEKKYSLCYCGGLTNQRGLYYLVEAAGLAQKKLLLAGAFSDAQFEEKIRALPGFRYTEYVGVVSNSQIPQLVQSSYVGANTLLNVGQYNHMDTFGIKVYEYMSLGVPVLLSDNAYSRQMVERYNFGVCVNPESPEEISQALIYILENPERAKNMGQNGRKAVLQKFNWDTQEKNLLELYETLATVK